jgi:hypothetical protein
MKGMASTKPAIFFKLKLLRCISFVLGCCVISILTLGATKGYDISHAAVSFLIIQIPIQ